MAALRDYNRWVAEELQPWGRIPMPTGVRSDLAHRPRPVLMTLIKQAGTGLLFRELEKRGYDMDARTTPEQRSSRTAMFAAEQAARRRYAALDEATKLALPERLNAKYRDRPVLGTVSMYDALAELAMIIDPLDPYLGAVSQLTHQLQIAMKMEEDGVNEQLVLVALVHDLGKLLIKFGDEDPINVEAGGKKTPLAGTRGAGLSDCTFRWDHGDFAYLRLRDHVEPWIAWLVRHHSIDVDACRPYMTEQDHRWCEELLIPFASYDDRKDLYALPRKQFEEYRPLIERTFPEPLLI